MWISEAVAVTTAEHAMATQELLDEDARLAARDGRPDAPLLVVRLDEVDVGYYLVPWRTTEGIGLIVRVDAATGQLLGFQEFGAPLPPGLLRAEQAIEAFRARSPRPTSANRVRCGFPVGRARHRSGRSSNSRTSAARPTWTWTAVST